MPDAIFPLVIRPWLEGDELELTQLFQQTFGRAITPEHWRWKLRPEPHALDNVWLAISDHKPVFQYAAIPVRFNVANEPVQALVSVDTMTAAEFRRRGLLTQVAQQAYSSWRAAGAAFVIGLPNENWGSRARALGWQPLFPLQWLTRPLRPEAILARLGRMPALGRMTILSSAWNAALRIRTRPAPEIQVARIDRADSSFDHIWDRCKADWTFTTIRDRRWVQWRFLSTPSRAYVVTVARRNGEPTGYLSHTILSSGSSSSAYLAELCAQRADLATRNTLLANLINSLRQTPTESLHALAIPGTQEFSWLRRAGFLPRHAFAVQFVPLKADLPVDRMSDRQQWSLTAADFDVV
jgi:hypothetical protein